MKRALCAVLGALLTAASLFAETTLEKRTGFDGQAVEVDLKGVTIVIDPGHGGLERGAVGPTGLMEKDINLTVALYLRDMLEEAGARVVMTRDGDYTVSLRQRIEIAHRADADLLVSIHHNAMETPADYSMVLYDTWGKRNYSINVARSLLEKFEKYIWDVPWKEKRLKGGVLGPGDVYITREALVPTIIGEPCFISFAPREEWLRDESKLKAEAQAYFEAIAWLFSQDLPVIRAEIPEILSPGAKIPFEVSGDVADVGALIAGHEFPVERSGGGYLLTVPETEKIPAGVVRVAIWAENAEGLFARSLQRNPTFVPTVEEAKVHVFPEITLPAVRGAQYHVRYELLDRWGRPIPSQVYTVRAVGGALTTDGKEIIFSFDGQATSGGVLLELLDGQKVEIPLHFSSNPDLRVLVIKVETEDGWPLAGVDIYVDEITVKTDETGRAAVTLTRPDVQLRISVPGFADYTQRISMGSERLRRIKVSLKRLRGGAIFGRRIVLAYESAVPEEFIFQLKEKLEGFGADVVVFELKSRRDELLLTRKVNAEGDAVLVVRKEQPYYSLTKAEFERVGPRLERLEVKEDTSRLASLFAKPGVFFGPNAILDDIIDILDLLFASPEQGPS